MIREKKKTHVCSRGVYLECAASDGLNAEDTFQVCFMSDK